MRRPPSPNRETCSTAMHRHGSSENHQLHIHTPVNEHFRLIANHDEAAFTHWLSIDATISLLGGM
jgi:hypothetical protein